MNSLHLRQHVVLASNHLVMAISKSCAAVSQKPKANGQELKAVSSFFSAILKFHLHVRGRIHETERNQNHLARTRNLSRRYARGEEHHSRSLGQRQSGNARQQKVD